MNRAIIIQKAKDCLCGIKNYPIDVYAICKHVGIQIIPSDFEILEDKVGLKIDAVLQVNAGKITIKLNNEMLSSFARYAIGQCLGHYFLHLNGKQIIAVFRNNKNVMATEAQLFAQHLLIPRAQLYKVYRELVIPTVSSLAQKFQVPEVAVRERITELGDPDLSVI